MLAGLPQNPNYANPVVNIERAQARQRVVLERMRDTGVIDAAAARGGAGRDAEDPHARPARW